MSALVDIYPTVRDALIARYGRFAHSEMPREPFASILLVLLERTIDRKKASNAVRALGEADLLDPGEFTRVDDLEIIELATSVGVSATKKSVALWKRLARWVLARTKPIEESATPSLREDLLAINGIGSATADAILLHALRRPAFPIDRGSYRVLVRHGWLDTTVDYDEARDLFERLEPDDVPGLIQLTSWLDQLGSEFCRASVAKCERCPLRPFLPDNGPIDPSGG